MKGIIQDFEESLDLLEQFISNPENFNIIRDAGHWMVEAIHQQGKIIACGNGGSMSDAMHFAEELTGRFRDNRKALPAIAISDPTHLSCVANDFGFPYVFSRYIEALGQQQDILLAISTSGNSENMLEAAKAAKSKGMKVIALTGKDGGKLAELADIEIRAPYSKWSDRAQEIHIKIIHSLIHYIERNLGS